MVCYGIFWSGQFRLLVTRERAREGLSPPRAPISFRASYHDIYQIVDFRTGCREDPTLDSQPVGLGPSPAPTP